MMKGSHGVYITTIKRIYSFVVILVIVLTGE